jgi:small membrane protein
VIIKLAGVLFSLFALSRVILRFREGRISWGMLLVWVFTWLSVIVFIIVPDNLSWLSKAIGIQRPLDLMLIGGLIMSFYLMFRVYVHVDEMRSDIVRLVRDRAIEDEF